METTLPPPDETTAAVCRWLLAGGGLGAFTGADPGERHDLSPLLSKETGRRDVYVMSAAAWFRLEQTLLPVIDSVRESGAVLWAVKGFDLAQTLYPFPGARPMCDADFLVEKRHLGRVTGAFLRAGWEMRTPGRGVFSSGIVSELKMTRLGVTAELHTHPFYFPSTLPGRLPGDLYTGGRRIPPGVMALSWHNSLLVCLLHMLTNTVIRPVWWVDTCLLSAAVDGNGSWREFASGAMATGLGRPVAGLLRTASGILGAPVPGRVIGILESDERGRESVLAGLRAGRGRPTLTCLATLRGWKRVSWLISLLWLAATGRRPLRQA